MLNCYTLFTFTFYYLHIDVCKRSLGWINYDNYVHITQPKLKIYNCDVSFANGELHQASSYST